MRDCHDCDYCGWAYVDPNPWNENGHDRYPICEAQDGKELHTPVSNCDLWKCGIEWLVAEDC
jgi:hypothetical protein